MVAFAKDYTRTNQSARIHTPSCFLSNSAMRSDFNAPSVNSGIGKTRSFIYYTCCSPSSAQGGYSGDTSRSGLGNALRHVPILGGILGGIGDAVSGLGNIAKGNFGAGFSQIGGGIGRTFGNVWAFPNTAVGIVYGGVGMAFGAKPLWDSQNAILRFVNMPRWLMPTAMSLGHAQVFGPGSYKDVDGNYALNRYDVPVVVEETLHTRQADILGPLYFPAHISTMGGSIITGGGTHNHNLLEMGPERGVSPWP